MRSYLLRRIAQAFGVVIFVTTLSFVLLHLAPGDPVSAALDGPRVTESVRRQWRSQLGLDRPISEQYVRWVGSAIRGELGYSISLRRPVRDVFADALPRTLLLSGLSMMLSFALGIGVAVLQAERPGSARDKWLGRTLLLLYSVPSFWLALVVLIVFAYKLSLFPVGGVTDPFMYEYLSPAGKALDRLKHLVLPVITLSLLATASIARYQRTALMATLPSDWIRTALAKGLSWRRTVRRHALRNALLPTITLFGLALSSFIVGAVFVEKVFAWPGLGYLTVSAIAAHDYHLVTSGVLVLSVIVVIGSLLADLAVAVADPRIRLD